MKKKRVQPSWHFSFSRNCWGKLFPWKKSKPRHFRNVSMSDYAKILDRSSNIHRSFFVFFSLQRVSTSNRAFQFILCTRGGPHFVSCIFILVFISFLYRLLTCLSHLFKSFLAYSKNKINFHRSFELYHPLISVKKNFDRSVVP